MLNLILFPRTTLHGHDLSLRRGTNKGNCFSFFIWPVTRKRRAQSHGWMGWDRNWAETPNRVSLLILEKNKIHKTTRISNDWFTCVRSRRSHNETKLETETKLKAHCQQYFNLIKWNEDITLCITRTTK